VISPRTHASQRLFGQYGQGGFDLGLGSRMANGERDTGGQGQEGERGLEKQFRVQGLTSFERALLHRSKLLSCLAR
jgi:hypothetical protein